MTEPAKSACVLQVENSNPLGAVPLESIVCTQELRNRPWRLPEYEKENRALAALASALADSPRTILQTLADKVLELLRADSAGLSLLTKDEKRFYWAAVAGAWRPHIGADAPRNFGPCGDVLDHNTPMLFNHWERRYPYLTWAMPLADEGLVVPFYVNGKAVGTIWAVVLDNHRKFDTEDLRLLESMSRFASAACQARVTERMRIARDLHDTLLQNLHGLMFKFQAARNMFAKNPEKALEALDGAILGTEEAIAESRTAIQDLRSEPVANSDLAESLTSFSQDLAASYYANFKAPTFRMVVEGERQDMSPALHEEVYRIAREVLRNAFRHARAHGIEAEIRYDFHEFRLRIRDDGKGLEPKVLAEGVAAGHWGLSGMRERAQQIGAQLSVWSEANAGTEVQLTVPAALAYQT